MEKAHLVYLDTAPFTRAHTQFKEGKEYRCLLQEDGESRGALIFGEWFNLTEYKQFFRPVIDVIHEEWKELGLIVDGKPLSKTAFKKRLDFHKYGRGQGSFYSAYIYGEHPKVLMFQFNTYFAENKSESFNTFYENYVDVVKGEWNPIDQDVVNRGNSGVPICFNNIYWKPQNNYKNIL